MATTGKSCEKPSSVDVKPDQPMLSSTMSHWPTAATRLHEVARQEIVDCWIAAGLRMTPAQTLDWCQAERRQRGRHRLHVHFRIEQYVRSVRGNQLAPLLNRLRSLVEALAKLRRELGLRIYDRASVIADELKPLAVELRQPPLDHDFPDRMPPEKSRHDPHTQWLGRSRRRRQRHGW